MTSNVLVILICESWFLINCFAFSLFAVSCLKCDSMGLSLDSWRFRVLTNTWQSSELMLAAVAGGYCHLGTVIGGHFYTEAISSSLPPCTYLLKIPWNFFCFVKHELGSLVYKGFEKWVLCITNGIMWIDYSEHFFLFT